MENWKKVGKRVASYFVVISGLIMIVLILFSILAWVDFRSETEGTTVAIGIAVLSGLFILDSSLSFGLFKMEGKKYQSELLSQAKKTAPYTACGLLAAPLLLLVSIPISWLALFLIFLWLLGFTFSLFLFFSLCIGALMERKRAKPRSTEPTP